MLHWKVSWQTRTGLTRIPDFQEIYCTTQLITYNLVSIPDDAWGCVAASTLAYSCNSLKSYFPFWQRLTARLSPSGPVFAWNALTLHLNDVAEHLFLSFCPFSDISKTCCSPLRSTLCCLSSALVPKRERLMLVKLVPCVSRGRLWPVRCACLHAPSAHSVSENLLYSNRHRDDRLPSSSAHIRASLFDTQPPTHSSWKSTTELCISKCAGFLSPRRSNNYVIKIFYSDNS